MADRLRASGSPPAGALLTLAASLGAFALIAAIVLAGALGTDQRLADWLYARATDPLTDFVEGVTLLGNFVTLLAVTLVAATILWRRKARIDAAFVVVALAGAQLLSNGLKLVFQRERPFFPDPLATASSYSFPSGHAVVSLAVYGAIALVLARHLSSPMPRAILFGGVAVLVLAIGFSRLYLGVHFLSDILAGYAVGIGWLSLLYAVALFHDVRAGRQYERWPRTKSGH
jgi:membrane-associated phospholipid phosphatase